MAVVPVTDAVAGGGLQKKDGSQGDNHPPSQTPSAKVSRETVHLAGLGVKPLIFKRILVGKPGKIIIDNGTAGEFEGQSVVDRLGLDTNIPTSHRKFKLRMGPD